MWLKIHIYAPIFYLFPQEGILYHLDQYGIDCIYCSDYRLRLDNTALTIGHKPCNEFVLDSKPVR